MPIKESPSYTKPLGKPGDERKHPKGDKVDYTKYTKEGGHKETGTGQGYKSAGKDAKTGKGGDERVRPGGDNADYSKYTRELPFKETGTGQGYRQVGKEARTTKGDGSERKYANKNKSPFRNA